MAGITASFYRNYNSSDTTVQTATVGTNDPYPQPFWDPPQGYVFKEWNEAHDGSSISHQAGQAFDFNGGQGFYAIWEVPHEINLVDATQLDIALTATADAIREKTGDSSQISWDTTSGFADAIDDIECMESADGVSFGTIPMISFSINSASSIYQAIEGMTWAEWIVSEYNIDGYKISGNCIVNAAETRQVGHIYGISGGSPSPNDYIIADAFYTAEKI